MNLGSITPPDCIVFFGLSKSLRGYQIQQSNSRPIDERCKINVRNIILILGIFVSAGCRSQPAEGQAAQTDERITKMSPIQKLIQGKSRILRKVVKHTGQSCPMESPVFSKIVAGITEQDSFGRRYLYQLIPEKKGENGYQYYAVVQEDNNLQLNTRCWAVPLLMEEIVKVEKGEHVIGLVGKTTQPVDNHAQAGTELTVILKLEAPTLTGTYREDFERRLLPENNRHLTEDQRLGLGASLTVSIFK